jgi:hypothetical protein
MTTSDFQCLLISYFLGYFRKAAGVLELDSYGFKGLKKLLVQSQMSFRKRLVPVIKGFCWGLTIFCKFLHRVSSGFQQPIITGISGFRKLFCEYSSAFRKAAEKRKCFQSRSFRKTIVQKFIIP